RRAAAGAAGGLVVAAEEVRGGVGEFAERVRAPTVVGEGGPHSADRLLQGGGSDQPAVCRVASLYVVEHHGSGLCDVGELRVCPAVGHERCIQPLSGGLERVVDVAPLILTVLADVL